MPSIFSKFFQIISGHRANDSKNANNKASDTPPAQEQYPIENNPAFLFLLSKFQFPNRVSNFRRDNDTWEKALKTKVPIAIDRLRNEGFLRNPDIASVMSSEFTSNELKDMARERGLPVSGTKDVLGQRLAEANLEEMEKKVRIKKYFICSEKGLKVVGEFQNSEKERKNEAQKNCLEHLRKEQFQEASRIVGEYEAGMVFKRGVGIDWKNYDTSGDVTLLENIFAHTPKRLVGLAQERLLELKVAAGMLHLWGLSNPSPWISVVYLDEIELHAEVGATLLLSHGQHVQRVQSMKEAGIRKVEIALGGGADACRECKKRSGRVYSINKVPDIPFENCICEDGCSCFIFAPLTDAS